MIKITVFDREDVKHEFEAPTDMNLNLMELCKGNGLPIEAICGGMALCASCHCYIESDHKLPEPSEDEEVMLDQAFYIEDTSRLSCQIKLTDDLDGLVIRIAPDAG